jgi:hypothetical protein
MSEIVEPFWAQNLVNKFSKSLAIISRNHQLRKTEFFKLVATFTKAVSRKTAIQFLALLELNLENCQYQGLLEISRPKSLSMEEIHVFLLLNQKLLISQLILTNMISLWWAQMVSLISWKMNKFPKNFGIWETNPANPTFIKLKVINSHSLERPPLELSQNPWKVCLLITWQLCLSFLTVKTG